MSVITSYTLACDKRAPEQCAERVGPFPTLREAQEAAEAAGRKLTYGHLRIDSDRCRAHVHIMDRVDWGSTN